MVELVLELLDASLRCKCGAALVQGRNSIYDGQSQKLGVFWGQTDDLFEDQAVFFGVHATDLSQDEV